MNGKREVCSTNKDPIFSSNRGQSTKRGYANQYIQKKKADKIKLDNGKRKQKKAGKSKYIRAGNPISTEINQRIELSEKDSSRPKQLYADFYGRNKSVSNKIQWRSASNASSSAASKVINLKELRDKEKQRKQANVDLSEMKHDKIQFSNSNFSNQGKNYATDKSDCPLPKEHAMQNKTVGNIYRNQEQNNMSYRSYTHLSSDYMKARSDNKLSSNLTHDHQVNNEDLLQLKREMLNQEYEELELQKNNILLPYYSSNSSSSRNMSSCSTPKDYRKEY